jgi:hypothetical protein
MSTNKEHIESLEARLDGLQDGLHRMELRMADKFSQLEATLNHISEMFFSNKESTNHDTYKQDTYSHSHRDNNEGPRLVVSSKTAKLEFPKFSWGYPTE